MTRTSRFIHSKISTYTGEHNILRGVLKKIRTFTGEQPCRSAISINLQSNFIEITLWHRCSPVDLRHILRTTFPKNTWRATSVYFVTFLRLQENEVI